LEHLELMAQGKHLDVKRDSRPHQASERQQKRDQNGYHRQRSLSVGAGKFNRGNAYRVFSRDSHRIREGHVLVAAPILGGLHHEYRLEPRAA
jgi:hypothetical protein